MQNLSLVLLISLVGCQPKFTDDSGTTPEADADADADADTDTDTTVVVQLFINEFMASNASYVFEDGKDPDSGEQYTPDWIELYNSGSVAVDLSGYTITDDFEEPEKHTLQNLTIDAGGYLLLFADNDPDWGDNHLGFKLSSTAESIGLYSPDGTALDLVDYTDQTTDMVAARIPDGGNLQITAEATPGSANPTSVD
jgi:hypothetical protein